MLPSFALFSYSNALAVSRTSFYPANVIHIGRLSISDVPSSFSGRGGGGFNNFRRSGAILDGNFIGESFGLKIPRASPIFHTFI